MIKGIVEPANVFGYLTEGVPKEYVDEQFESWDDITFSMYQAKKGVNDKPDFDYTDFGLLFSQNDQSEYIVLIDQFSHSYKFGTAIHPHIHYIQTSNTTPKFILQYRWYDNGAVVPAFTTIETTGNALPYIGGTMLQILNFPSIVSTVSGLSSWLDLKLFRKTGNGVTGDILVKTFDIHYQKDSNGSNSEYIK